MVRKKVLAGFVLFMGAMWVCTLVSKSLYATRLPVVNTVMPEENISSILWKWKALWWRAASRRCRP